MALYHKKKLFEDDFEYQHKKNNKLIMKSLQDNKQKTCYICKYIFNY